MRIRFLGERFTDYFSICNLLSPLHRDVGVVDNFKIIRPVDALVVWYIKNITYALAQLAKSIGVQLIPIFLTLGMFPQLPVFEVLSHFFIEHWNGPVKEKFPPVTLS